MKHNALKPGFPRCPMRFYTLEKPIIDRTFPLDAIADAHRYMESNRQLGKIVVTVS